MKCWLAAALLLTGCSTTLTPGQLGPSVAETFAGLYSTQQAGLGRTDVVRRELRPLGSCRRTGTSPDGPGEDWTCTVQYVDSDTAAVQSFEVRLKPDGCWTADGPPGTQPATLTDAQSGLVRSNPLSQFDGCLDVSAH